MLNLIGNFFEWIYQIGGQKSLDGFLIFLFLCIFGLFALGLHSKNKFVSTLTKLILITVVLYIYYLLWMNAYWDGRFALLDLTVAGFMIFIHYKMEQKNVLKKELKSLNYLPIILLAILLVIIQIMLLLVGEDSQFAMITILGTWLFAIPRMLQNKNDIRKKKGNDENET